MDNLINDMDNVILNDNETTGIDPRYVTREYVIELTREYFRFLEIDNVMGTGTDDHMKAHSAKWHLLPCDTISLVLILAQREQNGRNTVLQLKETLTELSMLNATNFRDSDHYYISMLIDFIKNLEDYELKCTDDSNTDDSNTDDSNTDDSNIDTDMILE